MFVQRASLPLTSRTSRVPVRRAQGQSVPESKEIAILLLIAVIINSYYH